jgi:GTPase SAR1 family protein
MNIRLQFSLLLSAFLTAILIFILLDYTKNNALIIGAVFAIGASLVFFYVYYLLDLRNTASPYVIAIVGFPKSGKTTLIISLFGEVFAGKMATINKLTPHGKSTIERVNEGLALLRQKKALGPTGDQTRFGFRGDLELGRAFNRKKYKIEFGDFPGEDTIKYLNDHGPWLHNTEFFSWVMESDAMIFVIDLGRYLENYPSEKFIADTTSAFRAALQTYLDAPSDNSKRNSHPLVLAFSKSDLLTRDEINVNNIANIAEEGFRDYLPSTITIDNHRLDFWEKQVVHDFADLINYLDEEMVYFRFVFTSCLGTQDGRLLGFEELIAGLFPKHKSFGILK